MYSNVIRSDEYKEQLLNFIRHEYGIEATGIYPAKRGYYGETWKVLIPDRSYFLKLDYSAAHKRIYERSFPIVEHLCNHDNDFISRIIKTSDGKLSKRYDGAVLGMFEWIDGENIETDETKIPEYRMLAKVYTVPSFGTSIPRESFSGDSAAVFFEKWNALTDARICSIFENNRAKLEHRAKRLQHFANMCRDDTGGFVITHGDAGGNLLVNGDRHYLVDWDNPILAPPERDAWVMLCYQGKSEWANCVFHQALRQNGIGYTMRPERLAYYSYFTFFFYLNEYLAGFTRAETTREIEDYFDCWAEERIEYADRMF